MEAVKGLLAFRLRYRIAGLAARRPVEQRVRATIDAACLGYSGLAHWVFFRALLASRRLRDICILGVYHGRDLAYLATLARHLGRRDIRLTGVDRFIDAPCADWPDHLRGFDWERAGFGPPPSLERARANLTALGLVDSVDLVQSDAEDFLASAKQQFDVAYIDTSHDYETTSRTIAGAVKALRSGGIVAGDDFSDAGTWGVASAVRNAFSQPEVFGGWVWLAHARDYHPQEASQ